MEPEFYRYQKKLEIFGESHVRVTSDMHLHISGDSDTGTRMYLTEKDDKSGRGVGGEIVRRYKFKIRSRGMEPGA